jgi:hypothetical protein
MLFNPWQHSLMLFLYIGGVTPEQAADQAQAHIGTRARRSNECGSDEPWGGDLAAAD